MQSFEWDEVKAKSNLAKHGIDFDEAIQVFGDEHLLLVLERYVDGEARWQAIGMIAQVVVVVVVHTIEEFGGSTHPLCTLCRATGTEAIWGKLFVRPGTR
jgi:uncharacterized DUF497 family protein